MGILIYESELEHHGIKGMKWGIRRYQNKDGTLTDKGKKRYVRDIEVNKSKKKDNRIQIDGPDPKRWVQEDTSRRKKIIDSSSDMVRQFQRMERETSPKATRKTFDLSKMSDKELRDAVNRKSLENQYNNLFSTYDAPTVSNGRKVVRNILDASGDILAVGSSVLGIMIAIQTLKNGG